MEKECLVNPVGRGYLGTANTSSQKLPCLPWGEVVAQGILRFPLIPDQFGSDAMNYCRYLPGIGWTAPSCMVNVGGRTFNEIVNQSCEIPFCGTFSNISA